MECTTQLKTRKRNIAHRTVGRIFEHCKDIVLRKTYSPAERSYRFRYRSGNKFFDFCHTCFSLHNFRANTINPFYHKLYYTILFSFLQQEIEWKMQKTEEILHFSLFVRLCFLLRRLSGWQETSVMLYSKALFISPKMLWRHKFIVNITQANRGKMGNLYKSYYL